VSSKPVDCSINQEQMPLHQPTLPIEQSSAGRLENGTSGRVVVTASLEAAR
jgi:hypothetical protein